MEENIFSSIDFVGQCLVDHERTVVFQKAIELTVNKDDLVLELGTGSGVMSMFAAKAGAKEVVAVECDPYIANIAKTNFDLNGYSDQISVLIEDAEKLTIKNKPKFDVVISEMLTTGMIDECQVSAINNLHNQNLVDEKTRFIPKQQDTSISLVSANFTTYGLKLPMILHLWEWHNWDEYEVNELSDSILLNSIDFRSKVEEKFEKTIEISIKKPGVVSAIYMTSKTIFPNGASLQDTEALNGPMLIPIQGREVKAGDKLKIKIQYIFGGSYSNFKAEVIE